LLYTSNGTRIAGLINGISGRLLLAKGLMGFGKMNPRHGPDMQKSISPKFQQIIKERTDRNHRICNFKSA